MPEDANHYRNLGDDELLELIAEKSRTGAAAHRLTALSDRLGKVIGTSRGLWPTPRPESTACSRRL